jgi:hypothetical protein
MQEGASLQEVTGRGRERRQLRTGRKSTRNDFISASKCRTLLRGEGGVQERDLYEEDIPQLASDKLLYHGGSSLEQTHEVSEKQATAYNACLPAATRVEISQHHTSFPPCVLLTPHL